MSQPATSEWDAAAGLDAELRRHLPVQVRWTNAGNCYQAIGAVRRVNPKSVQVVLQQRVQTPISLNGPARGGLPPSSYPIGAVITVPRINQPARWSPDNGVFPR